MLKGLATRSFVLARSGRVSFTAAKPNRFTEVYFSSTESFAPKQITRFETQWKPFHLSTREVVQWKSSDGTLIEGILTKPADYDASRKYPLFVVIHGGPTGVDTPALTSDHTYPVEMFAAKGALILKPNYRRIGGLRREVQVVKCKKSRRGSLAGCHQRSRLSDRKGNRR